MPYSVYYLVDPITKIPRYVGFSRDPKERFATHLQCFKNEHKSRWIGRLLDEGVLPTLSIRCIVESREEACRVEIMLIAALRARGVDLTNITVGGDGGATMRGRVGPAHGAYGTKWTAIRRARHAESLTAEKRAAHGAAVKAGWAKRGNIPTKRKGRPWSEAQRNSIIAAIRSPEARRKNSEAQRGKTLSTKTRAAMQAGQKRRRASEAEAK